MPSHLDNEDVRDPIEHEDLIGDDEEDEDYEDDDDDIVDEEEDEDELDEREENEQTEDEVSAGARSDLTAEVGSEGGSPGETVDRVRDRAGLGRGSEATTTWRGGDDRTRDRRDEADVPVKRAPRG